MQLPRYNNERHPAEELTLLGRACSRLRFLVPSLPQPSSAQTISNRPKSPRRELPPVLTLNIPLSTPLASPRALASPARSTATAATPRSTPHGPTGITQQAPLPPLPAHSARPRQHVGVGPEDEQLAELVGASRPRRQQSKQTTKRRSCLPARGSPVRRKVIGCFISGTILVTTFTTYLALLFSSHYLGQEFHAVFILVILFTTLYFCHSLLRLCMLASNPSDGAAHFTESVGPGGYANPVQPIRVITAQDEEAAGAVPETTEAPPPAYGLWRCSVRADPNLLHWQRASQSPVSPVSAARPPTASRPPSYVSDEGVDYIVSPLPRSTVTPSEPALPPHPSERRMTP